jgi:hypothetical protein
VQAFHENLSRARVRTRERDLVNAFTLLHSHSPYRPFGAARSPTPQINLIPSRVFWISPGV